MAEQEDRSGERSGRYPGVSLGDALEAADKLYKAEKQSPMTNETAAVKMGYKGLSGPCRVMIGSLRQFGLIEKTAPGQFRLSRLAIEALHGNDAQKTKALATAALNPQLFSDLSRTHLDGSEDNIRSYLITTKGFIDTGARLAAKAFRDTMNLAQISASGYDEVIDRPETEDDAPGGWNPTMDQLMKFPPPVSSPPAATGVTTAREVSSLPEGEAILQWPASMSKESVADLEDWLALVVKKLKRRYASE